MSLLFPTAKAGRSAAMLSSALAMSTALALTPAYAQLSYNAGDPTVVSGSVTFDRGVTTPGTEVYTVASPTAVLDFTPTDTGVGGGPINFQNAGTTAIYQSAPGGPNFTVLNRIVPNDVNRAVAFNGNVVSQLVDASNNAVTGGSLWFYSPGGLIIGNGAVFDVGNLLLSTGDPTGGTGTIGSTTSFTLNSAADSTVGVTIAAGATVNALNSGSYIAMVAPFVAQSGSVNVDGSVAYVAAEQANLTVNQGLFDINVTVGSSANGGATLVHDGSTRGPASTGVGDNQAIYLVAVPKNDLITMIVAPTGQLGFDLAGSATVENGTIILAGNRNVSGTTVNDGSAPSTAEANIDIGPGNYTSSVNARASGAVNAFTDSDQLSFAGNVTLFGGTSASLTVTEAGTVTVGGDLGVHAAGNGAGGFAGITALNGGTLTVDGDIRARSDLFEIGVTGLQPVLTGGTAQIVADGGTIAAGGSISAASSPSAAGGLGRELTGGNVLVQAADGGAITTGGNFFADARVTGEDNVAATGAGGNAVGGNVLVSLDGGTIDVGGNTFVLAEARGGAGATGGSASTTSAMLVVGASGGRVSSGGQTTVSADATGGTGTNGNGGTGTNGNGGNATAGRAQILIAQQAGTVPASIALNDVFVTAGAVGGNATAGNGGIADAGDALLVANGGTFSIANDVSIDAIAIGGTGDSGGNAIGGNAGAAADFGGTMTIGAADTNFEITTFARGGSALAQGGSGGMAAGGVVGLFAGEGSSFSTAAQAFLDGGTVGGNSANGAGGDAVGGAPADPREGPFDQGVYVSTTGGTLTLGGGALLLVDATGGNGVSGGAGIGGVANIVSRNGTIATNGAFVSINASGTGGNAVAVTNAGGDVLLGGGAGGDGQGGRALVFGQNTLADTRPSTLSLGGVSLNVTGSGGGGATGLDGQAGGAGGAGVGGAGQFLAAVGNGVITAGAVSVDTSGFGGAGGTGGAANGVGVAGAGGAGGSGEAGLSTVGISSGPDTPHNLGTVTVAGITQTANGFGGAGGDASAAGASGGAGGDGIGGHVAVLARGGPVIGGAASLQATGTGGSGGVDQMDTAALAGNGQGGNVDLIASNRFERTERGSLTLGQVNVAVGGSIGNAIAGAANVLASSGNVTITGGSFTATGAATGPGVLASFAASDGALTVGSTLSINTPGDVEIVATDGGQVSLQIANVNTSGSFVYGDRAAPSSAGSVSASSGLTGTIGGDFLAYRDMPVGNLNLTAGGRILTRNIAADTLNLLSPVSVETGNITGNIVNGVPVTGFSTTLRAGTISPATNMFTATGAVRSGDITSTLVNASGTSLTLGNLFGGNAILLGSTGDITAGSLTTGVAQPRFLLDNPQLDRGILVNAGGNIAIASASSAGATRLNAGGSVVAGAITTGTLGIDAPLDGLGINAGTTAAIGNVNAAGSINVFAPGTITTGDLVAGTLGDSATSADVEISSDTGAITTGSIRGVSIVVRQGAEGSGPFGAVTLGDMFAETIGIDAQGDLTTGNIVGANYFAELEDEDEFLLGLKSEQGSVRTGNITGLTYTGIAALNDVTTGTINAPAGLLVLAGNNVSLGDATTNTSTAGTVFISNISIVATNPDFSDVLNFGDVDSDFDPSVLPTSTPVRLGGSLAISGPVMTGNFRVAAAGAIDTGAITAPSSILINGGASIATGNIDTLMSLSLQSVSTLTTGNIESAGGNVSLAAQGAIRLGNVRAAGAITIAGMSAISAGDLTAGTGPLIGGDMQGGSGGTGSGGGDAAPGGIAAGFDGANLGNADDVASDGVLLPFEINYFGTRYTVTYVSNNGYLTFNQPQTAFSPEGLGSDYTGQPIIAAFFADVDTSNLETSPVTYGSGTFAGRQAFGATYQNVGYYDSNADKLNSFQIILTDRSDTGIGNFDIYYNYGGIQWETGDVDGGVGGLGGNSAAVGYNAGLPGNPAGTFFELPGSQVPGSFLDNGTMPLVLGTNNGTPGQLVFSVRNGQVTPGGGATGRSAISVSNVGAAAGSEIALGNLTAETVEVHSAASIAVGDVTATDLGSGLSASGMAAILDATVNIDAGDIRSNSFVVLGAGQGNVSTGSITAATTVAVLADGSVSLGAVSTGGEGSLFISNDSILESAPELADFDLDSLLGDDALDLGLFTTLSPVATRSSISIEGPVSTGVLLAASSGTARFAGTVAARTIDIASGDIQLVGETSLGGSTTESITLRMLGGSATLGGSGDASGYSLSAAEGAALRANRITLTSTQGDVLIRDLAFNGTRNEHGAGVVSITSGGAIRLEGLLQLANASDSDQLSLTSATRIGVATDRGGAITVTGDGTALGGVLRLAAPDIAVADANLLDGLARNPRASGRDAVLAQPRGDARPEGFIQARTLEFAPTNTLLIRNSGTLALAAGFTAGAGGMRVFAPEGGTVPVDVVINGRVQTPVGDGQGQQGTSGFLTNADTRTAITFTAGQGSPGFSTLSSVNGCTITTGVCGTGLVSTIVQTLSTDVQAIAQAAASTQSAEEAASVPSVEIATVIDATVLGTDTLIDEPVTGGGNATLWNAPGEDDDDDDDGGSGTAGGAVTGNASEGDGQ